MNQFEKEIIDRINENKNNKSLLETAKHFFIDTVLSKYCYNFSAFGRPIIQYPQDMVAMQEIIWEVKPDLIIETGQEKNYYECKFTSKSTKKSIEGIDVEIVTADNYLDKLFDQN